MEAVLAKTVIGDGFFGDGAETGKILTRVGTFCQGINYLLSFSDCFQGAGQIDGFQDDLPDMREGRVGGVDPETGAAALPHSGNQVQVSQFFKFRPERFCRNSQPFLHFPEGNIHIDGFDKHPENSEADF
jgi:hypothetical protein